MYIFDSSLNYLLIYCSLMAIEAIFNEILVLFIVMIGIEKLGIKYLITYDTTFKKSRQMSSMYAFKFILVCF